jgi:hypothetical protein
MMKLLSTLKRLIRRPFERHKDMTLTCAECNNTFRFEWGEQQFFQSRGLTPPKRCTSCRSASRGGRSFRGNGGGRRRRR